MTSPLRLLRVAHSLNPAGGGVAEAIRQFGSSAQQANCDLTVVCVDDPNAGFLDNLPFTTYAVGPCSNRHGYHPPLRKWLEINVAAFDMILIDGLWQYPGYVTRSVCRRHSRPYAVMPHGMLDPWFRQRYPLKHLKKYLYWLACGRQILADAQVVIYTAEEERRKAGLSFRPYKATERVVPLGIRIPQFDQDSAITAFRNTLPSLGERPYLLFIGRLHEKKGVDLLIRAYRRWRSATDQAQLDLVIAGPPQDPDYERQLRDLAAGCATIHFAGMLKGDQKWGALSGARAMALPSHQENFGIVVAESLAVGTPVLISHKVDIWREICDDGAGWAEADTEEGTFALLQRLGQADADTYASLRNCARLCFSQRFNLDHSARQLVKTLAANTKPSSANNNHQRCVSSGSSAARRSR